MSVYYTNLNLLILCTLPMNLQLQTNLYTNKHFTNTHHPDKSPQKLSTKPDITPTTAYVAFADPPPPPMCRTAALILCQISVSGCGDTEPAPTDEEISPLTARAILFASVHASQRIRSRVSGARNPLLISSAIFSSSNINAFSIAPAIILSNVGMLILPHDGVSLALLAASVEHR